MLDQGDVGLFMWVLDATELPSHREKVGRHLTGVHQQHGSVNMWICTLRVRGLSCCGWKTQMPWHSLLKKNKLLFRSDELIRSDTLSLKHYSHVLAENQSNKNKHSTLVNSVVCIYMVLEHWPAVMRPCSSLTSLWKEIPVKEVKKGNSSFLYNSFMFSKNRLARNQFYLRWSEPVDSIDDSELCTGRGHYGGIVACTNTTISSVSNGLNFHKCLVLLR